MVVPGSWLGSVVVVEAPVVVEEEVLLVIVPVVEVVLWVLEDTDGMEYVD